MMLISAWSGFLEEKSQDEVLVRTVQDYDELLLGYMHNSNGYLMLYALDDDIGINEAKLGTGTTENGVILDYSGCLTWQPNMWEQENKIDDGYQYTYDNIKGLNAVLDGIDEVHGSQQEKELIKELFDFISKFEGDIPGAYAVECGNYLDQNLAMARYEAQKFLEETLNNIKEENLNYPK